MQTEGINTPRAQAKANIRQKKDQDPTWPSANPQPLLLPACPHPESVQLCYLGGLRGDVEVSQRSPFKEGLAARGRKPVSTQVSAVSFREVCLGCRAQPFPIQCPPTLGDRVRWGYKGLVILARCGTLIENTLWDSPRGWPRSVISSIPSSASSASCPLLSQLSTPNKHLVPQALLLCLLWRTQPVTAMTLLDDSKCHYLGGGGVAWLLCSGFLPTV